MAKIKTREEQVARMAELSALVDEKVIAYNEAIQDGGTADEIAEIDAATQKAIGEYTGIAKRMAFADCLASEDPMLAAITRLTFSTITVKDTEKEEITVRSRDSKNVLIDLLALNDIAPNGIGKDPKWPAMCEKLNCLYAADLAKEIGIDPKSVKDSWTMSDIAKELDMGKTPTSKTNILKTMNAIIAAMVGTDYKATTHHTNYLYRIYASKAKKILTVRCPKPGKFVEYIEEIIHGIILEKDFDIEYVGKKS